MRVKWVRPLIVENREDVSLDELPVRSGRIEG